MILLFVKMFLSVFLFDVCARLWVLIRSVPEVSLHIDIFIIYTVDSRYLEIEGTIKNSSRNPYFDISDL